MGYTGDNMHSLKARIASLNLLDAKIQIIHKNLYNDIHMGVDFYHRLLDSLNDNIAASNNIRIRLKEEFDNIMYNVEIAESLVRTKK